MKHPSQIFGMMLRRSEAAEQIQQIGELKRLTSKGFSLSEAAQIVDIDYQQAVRLMELLEVNDETNR